MILLLDTSTPVCRVTLIDGKARRDWQWQADRTLARHLLRYLTDCLKETGHTLQDVSGIGVMTGPGSFTGLRIGMAVSNTLADALSIPIVGARGDAWQDEALRRLEAGETDQVVLPHYGGEAHITQPRK
jgi:tRNA threonylcarbamoyl adenosine modification protein YeaZ